MFTVAGEVEEEGYADEYQLEDLEVSAADYMKPVMVPNFRKAWCVGWPIGFGEDSSPVWHAHRCSCIGLSKWCKICSTRVWVVT
eukprot:1156863-Pelagomonas_calceolata.AAC.12